MNNNGKFTFSPDENVLGTFPIGIELRDNNRFNPKQRSYTFTVTVKEPEAQNSTSNDTIIINNTDTKTNTTKPNH
jgi:hypothetical protein